MNTRIIILTLLLTLCWHMYAQNTSHLTQTPFGEIDYIYDPNKITSDELDKISQIHPEVYDPDLLHANSLELCIENNANYYKCTSRDINDPNFLKNAKINIKLSQERLLFLETLSKIDGLEMYSQYFINSFQFSLKLMEVKLSYYETWDIDKLQNEILDIKPDGIEDLIKRINDADSKLEKYRLVKFDYHNLFNRKYKNQETKISKELWKKFLIKYELDEVIKSSF